MRASWNHWCHSQLPCALCFCSVLQIMSLTQSEARKQNSSHTNFRIDFPNPLVKRVLAAFESLTGFAPAVLEASLRPSDARLQLLCIGRMMKHLRSATVASRPILPTRNMLCHNGWWSRAWCAWLRASMAPAPLYRRVLLLGPAPPAVGTAPLPEDLIILGTDIFQHVR